MRAKLCTFFDIFTSEFDVKDKKTKVKNIVIPKIQRDYAQGRKGSEVERVRNRFLKALREAITEKDITLDFIYGDIDIDGRMTPLDGQQRLTTLFLLHTYAAKKEGISSEEYDFLNHFSYEVRYSARDFCFSLVNEYTPSFEKTLSEEIIDQSWFPSDWQKDPTVSSMLVMLDAIDEYFTDISNIWERLKAGAISFYFLLNPSMGLTDELYIKMNSRGKPLTQFEHFKAEFEQNLRKTDKALCETVMSKIDKEWTDLLWQYRNEDNIIDDEFLRYFRFICDIICYESDDSPIGKSNDEFDLLEEYFSPDAENTNDNIEKLVSMFDCWCDLGGITPSEFMKKFASEEHQADKTILDPVDIFADCTENYADVLGNGNRKFPLNRIVLLFAVVTYLQNKDTVTEEEFARRLRIINNIIRNSSDEISDRTDNNRLPAILRQTKKIILTGAIDLSIRNALNVNQLKEEIEKVTWCENNPSLKEMLFELEDHDLLHGQISVVGLENPDLFPRFKSLFSCNWDLVDCALTTIGLYSQWERGWRYQNGSGDSRNKTPWRNLFHKSKSDGFENTKEILCELLRKTDNFTDDFLEKFIKDYISSCEEKSEFPIRYYYIKYPHFRPSKDGKYTWEDRTGKPYEMAVMQTQRNWSENTYQPFLISEDTVMVSPSREHKGQRIVLDNVYISCVNDAYVIRQNDNDTEIERISISQNEQGIDTENRIVKFGKLYGDIVAKYNGITE